MTVMTVQAPSMSNDPISGGFHLFISRGGAFGETCLSSALARAEELKIPYLVNTGSSRDGAALRERNCLGAAGMFYSDEVRRVARAAKFPVINFSNRSGILKGLANFLSDDHAVGAMAAGHMLQRGYRHFFVIAPEQGIHGMERIQGFQEALQSAGYSCRTLTHNFQSRPRQGSVTSHVQNIEEDLKPHIATLPFDTGIFAVNDWIGGLVQRTLMDHFPERLYTTGVLGVDNEQTTWWYLVPLAGLSSIVPGFRTMGAAAMEWLIQHPRDKAAASGLLQRFKPLTVIERASTAGCACADPVTARMARWAWSQIQDGNGVLISQIAAHHHMSRRSAERRFTENLSMGAGDYIQGLKLDLARQLLKSTDLPISEISLRCGFAKQDVLSRAIKLKEGLSPREFRQSHRPPIRQKNQA